MDNQTPNPVNLNAPVVINQIKVDPQVDNQGNGYQNINSINAPNDEQNKNYRVVVNSNQPTKTEPDNKKEDNFYPSLDMEIAIVILVINVIFPGVGTMIVGCVSGHKVGTFICIGIAQMLLSVVCVGFIWAVYTGVMILKHAKKK